MLVSRWVYDTAVYGGLVAVVTSAWYAIRHRERRVESKVPTATMGQSPRRYVARIAPVIILIALLGGEWALLSHARDAVIVDATASASRAVFIGDMTLRGPGNVVLVNRSEKFLRFLQVDYGDYVERYRIEPHAVTTVPEVDFLGPDHEPADDADAEHRTWLTWD